MFAVILLNSKRSLSATVTINSELVGLALSISTLCPKISSISCQLPLFQLTSIACLIALSTLDTVVSYLPAISGYNSFVIPPTNSGFSYTKVIPSRIY